MNEAINGQSPVPPAGQQQQIIATITPSIRTAIQTVMTGVMHSYPGIPHHVLLAIMSFEAGFYAGQALQGDISAMVNLRKGFKDSFSDGVQKAPLMAQKSDWVPPQEGVR